MTGVHFEFDRFIGYFAMAYIVVVAIQMRSNLFRSLVTYRTITAGQARAGVLMAIGTIALIITLGESVPDVMRWGWPNLFDAEPGNVLLSPATQASGNRAGITMIVTGIVFMVFLVPLLPLFVAGEERIFRYGMIKWPDIVIRSVAFGLIHMVVGLPLYAGLALILPGFVLGWFYRRAHAHAEFLPEPGVDPKDHALTVSRNVHLSYNLFIFGLFTLVLILLLVNNLQS